MKTTIELLAAVRAKHGATWYGLQKILGLTKTTITRYRKGIGYFDDDVALRVADDLGLDRAYVLTCVAAERSRRAEVKAVWIRTAEKLAGATIAAVAIYFAVPLLDFTTNSNAIASSEVCILCQIKDCPN